MTFRIEAPPSVLETKTVSSKKTRDPILERIQEGQVKKREEEISILRSFSKEYPLVAESGLVG